MTNNAVQEQWAIFLAAICEQTYAQYTNNDGFFVVPSNYSLVDTIHAQSISHVWERFGFILESENDIIIAFRGTSSTNDWIADVLASQIKFPYLPEEDCLTHHGFTEIYSSAREQVVACLGDLSPDKNLYITGHSLGAALSTLCAVDVAANTNHTAPQLFTYGSPRVGDPEFATVFTTYVPNSYRLANLYDIVTYAPPAVYKLPMQEKKYYYSHVPTLVSLSFQHGSIKANHMVGSYFAELSKLQPIFTAELCTANPGFCPNVEIIPEK
ncbi:lipase family protein [Paenibacillus radicis (ex Gao et al. 2016)]|uniref:Lipase n=1 Tax=Paenibacillus radicis (ex Gao et al. 2016) TaxID=1737354 RepID=A0A917MA26_9BACL|nr:lipase family protein [Paenibacillus radicis (ex Gao et al. 2016)]GGG88674.1 lipase [Paenibacillus radicis (ex Gao et al. 2016)]